MRRHILYRYYIYFYRLNLFRILRKGCVLICLLFIFIHYLSTKFFTQIHIPSSISTRLHPDRPFTINLLPYSVCRSNELRLKNITAYYHHRYTDKQQKTCFLIEYLDGGPWWSYVTNEFAEILTNLKKLGRESNITYRPFSIQKSINPRTNLTKYFFNACGMDENLPRENQIPIVILLWDINHPQWYRIHSQWDHFLKTTRTRLMVFIDDLHFTSKIQFNNRQYLFQSAASEIFSTYPYLFHNYYYNISSTKITWLPHAASTLSYPSINKSAENVLFVSGANLFDWYPCRSRAFILCETRKDLSTCLEHPGYGETMKRDNSFYYGGRRYSSYMRKYAFGLGTCQSVHYAIAKLFELPANGLALVTTNDLIPILKKLHLYHNKHYLTVDCSSVEILAKEILHLQNISRENLFELREKSQKIIFERHLTKHRAELLHVRLLSQALIISSTSDKEHTQWKDWGRNCY